MKERTAAELDDVHSLFHQYKVVGTAIAAVEAMLRAVSGCDRRQPQLRPQIQQRYENKKTERQASRKTCG